MVTEPDVVLEDAVVALEGDAVVLEGCVVALKKGTAVADEHCFSDVQLLYASEVASVPFIHICESLHLIHSQPVSYVSLPIHELHVEIFPQMSTVASLLSANSQSLPTASPQSAEAKQRAASGSAALRPMAAAQRGTATPARQRFPSPRSAPARRRAPSEIGRAHV